MVDELSVGEDTSVGEEQYAGDGNVFAGATITEAQSYDIAVHAAAWPMDRRTNSGKEGDLPGTTDDHPRRGSRGSILSGKANVEPEGATPTISAHHLAQLNLSTSFECDSDDSSTSDICDDSPSSSSRSRTRGRCQFGLAMKPEEGNRNEHRRHTLCASEQILSPDVMANLPIGSPLHQAALNHTALNDMALHSGETPLMASPQLPIFPGLPLLPILDYTRMLPVPSSERRASAGENLLNPGAIETLNHLVQPAQPSAAVPRYSDYVDIYSYLSKYSGKRNTVHGASSPFGPSSPVPRHSPYTKASSTERRSSWASPAITAQQHQQLERLYRQAISGQCAESLQIFPYLIFLPLYVSQYIIPTYPSSFS
ncbi:unnamed protein product [Cylicostephanus goldi]|uniref:Uncharacterized protein n=1 Tax=Cylicostephanus goldi TaxID=71465 RepID=A0A3P6QUG1_CYLGO|nr:unnamed protein product [Cylicostephanus goldi]